MKWWWILGLSVWQQFPTPAFPAFQFLMCGNCSKKVPTWGTFIWCEMGKKGCSWDWGSTWDAVMAASGCILLGSIMHWTLSNRQCNKATICLKNTRLTNLLITTLQTQCSMSQPMPPMEWWFHTMKAKSEMRQLPQTPRTALNCLQESVSPSHLKTTSEAPPPHVAFTFLVCLSHTLCLLCDGHCIHHLSKQSILLRWLGRWKILKHSWIHKLNQLSPNVDFNVC